MTCSVTVCSTWMRGLHSMKQCSPVSGRDEELDGAGVDVAGAPRRGATASARIRARSASVEARRRRDLDDLLVAQLHRAVAVEEVDDVAVGVGEDLHLDVAGPGEQPLDEHGAVAERRRRLAAAALERLGQLLGAVHGAHAAPAAAGRRLEHHRVADLVGGPRRVGRRRHRAGAAGDAPGRRCDAASARAATLSPNRASVSGRGPMNAMPGRRAALGERGVLGQEPVAGVHAVAAGLDRRRDDGLDVEVGGDRIGRRRRARGGSVVTRVCSERSSAGG